MIPAMVTRVPGLPRLPNGKIDHGALRRPVDVPRNQPLVLPRTPIEEGVAAIWRELLNQPQIGVDDHFFRLGGHSLLATQVVSRLNKRFGVDLEVDAVFRFPTIAEQAALVEGRLGRGCGAVVSEREGRAGGVTDAMRVQLLGWAGQRPPYPRDRTVPELFERQAADGPDQAALVTDSETLTYRQLNERANRLAHHLRTRMAAVDPETAERERPRGEPADLPQSVSIGVCLERSLDSIVTLLAILKAGAAYVPLDPAFPPARLAVLAERAGLRLVITCREFCDRLADVTATTILIDRDGDRSQPRTAPIRTVDRTPRRLRMSCSRQAVPGEPKGVAYPIVRSSGWSTAFPTSRSAPGRP